MDTNTNTHRFKIQSILPIKDDIQEGKIVLSISIYDTFKNIIHTINREYSNIFYLNTSFDLNLSQSLTSKKIINKINKYFDNLFIHNAVSNVPCIYQCPFCGKKLKSYTTNSEFNMPTYYCNNIKCIDNKQLYNNIYNKIKVLSFNSSDNFINEIIEKLLENNIFSIALHFDIIHLINWINSELRLNLVNNNNNHYNFINDIKNITPMTFFKLCKFPYIFEENLIDFCNSINNDLDILKDINICTNTNVNLIFSKKSSENIIMDYINYVVYLNSDILNFFINFKNNKI